MNRASVITTRLLAIALIAGIGCNSDDENDGPLDPADAIVLTNGTAVTGLAGAEGSRRLYKIVVPAGQAMLTITTELGTGDVDLYTRAGGVPSTALRDCVSNWGDNDELCEHPSPAAGDWYILLRGWDAYEGVTLTATYVAPPAPPTARK